MQLNGLGNNYGSQVVASAGKATWGIWLFADLLLLSAQTSLGLAHRLRKARHLRCEHLTGVFTALAFITQPTQLVIKTLARRLRSLQPLRQQSLFLCNFLQSQGGKQT